MKNYRREINPLSFDTLVMLAKQTLITQRECYNARKNGTNMEAIACEAYWVQARISLRAAKKLWNDNLQTSFPPTATQNLCSIFRVR